MDDILSGTNQGNVDINLNPVMGEITNSSYL